MMRDIFLPGMSETYRNSHRIFLPWQKFYGFWGNMREISLRVKTWSSCTSLRNRCCARSQWSCTKVFSVWGILFDRYHTSTVYLLTLWRIAKKKFTEKIQITKTNLFKETTLHAIEVNLYMKEYGHAILQNIHIKLLNNFELPQCLLCALKCEDRLIRRKSKTDISSWMNGVFFTMLKQKYLMLSDYQISIWNFNSQAEKHNFVILTILYF